MKQIVDAVGAEFELLESPLDEHPRFVHKSTGILFQFVPGGEYLMGFSDEEERMARALTPVLQMNVEEMRPVTRRMVGPLLVSATPILNKHIANFAILPLISNSPLVSILFVAGAPCSSAASAAFSPV